MDERQLLSNNNFFNKFNDKDCTSEEYSHALDMWNTFNCTTFKEYMELYLKTDVLLMTDVFENFRKLCKNIYKLDPFQYYTAPGLQLLTDIDMYNFFF